MKKLLIVLMLITKTILLITAFFCYSTISGQPGQFDPFFANKGIIRADLGARVTQHLISDKIIVQSDASMYILLQTGGKALVAKRKPDGSPDLAYGINGFSIAITLGDEYHVNGKMVMQSDGKLVVAGYIQNGYNGNDDVSIVRFNVDGSLDKSFGNGGFVRISYRGYDSNWTSGGDDLQALVVGLNNQILVSSSYWDNELEGYPFIGSYITFLNSNGSVNKVFSAISSDNLSVQNDGKIVVAGEYERSGNYSLARYNTDGSFDKTFDNDGMVTTSLQATSMSVTSDGKILLGGGNEIYRYTSSGKLDLTFSGDGKVQVLLKVNSIIPFVDGKFGIAGGKALINSENLDFAIARYTAAGGLDNTFSADGIDVIDFGGNEEAYSVSKINGKMVIVGTTGSGYVKQMIM